MKENTQDKSLVQVNENSIFYKIKQFFRKMFYRTNSDINESINITERTNIDNKENNKNSFIKEIRNIEDEEILILKLQKQYRNGEIKEEDLTEEQISSLCDLYDKQIEDLRKSNEIRKQKLLEYRKKMQTNN